MYYIIITFIVTLYLFYYTVLLLYLFYYCIIITLFRQMMITREDHVSIITYPTDMKIVEHEDGTRITTFTKEVEKSASEGEEKQGMM